MVSRLESAVALDWLLEFAAEYADHDPGITTIQLAKQVVLPRTKIQACSYADLIADTKKVSKATYVVSHSSSCEFRYITDALRSFFHDVDPTSVFIWLDLVSVRASRSVSFSCASDSDARRS
eukprot:192491-Chlamydomonas_euryale.AAC.3